MRLAEMKRSLLVTTLLICLLTINNSCEQEKRVNVGTLRSDSINASLTPAVVDRNPNNYCGEGVCWVGKIQKISEAGEGMVYTYKIGRYSIEGETLLRIMVNGDGTFQPKLYRFESSLKNGKYLCNGRLPASIREGDFILFKGMVVGVDPEYGDVIAVHEINQIDTEAILHEGLNERLGSYSYLFPQIEQVQKRSGNEESYREALVKAVSTAPLLVAVLEGREFTDIESALRANYKLQIKPRVGGGSIYHWAYRNAPSKSWISVEHIGNDIYEVNMQIGMPSQKAKFLTDLRNGAVEKRYDTISAQMGF
jgi:hypothetical protein